MSDNPPRRILFVDDDLEFLQVMERLMLLWSNNSWEVVTAKSASDALSIIQTEEISLAILDIAMPVVDGLQLLTILHRRFPELQKVVLTGHASEAYRSACLSHGADLFLEKPSTQEGLESIFATIKELLRWKPEPGFRGVLRRVELMDVIQMECLGKSSSVLSVTSGSSNGRIFIKEGTIVHAETEGCTGEEAFYRLFALQSGDFCHSRYSEPPQQTITAQWEFLLMQAAHLRDEKSDGEEDRNTPAIPLPGPTKTVSLERAPRTREVQEFLVCSPGGDVLHSWQCPNSEFRINFMEFLSQKSKTVQKILRMGSFDHVEFKSGFRKFLVQIKKDRAVTLRTSSGHEDDGAELQRPATPVWLSPIQKTKAEEWFQQNLDLSGLLAASLQFSDKSGINHSLFPALDGQAVESVRRLVTETFHVLNLQRFSATHAHWRFDEGTISAAQWKDGTCIVFIGHAQALDSGSLEEKLSDFLDQEGY